MAGTRRFLLQRRVPAGALIQLARCGRLVWEGDIFILSLQATLYKLNIDYYSKWYVLLL